MTKSREILFDNKWVRVVKLNGWFVSTEPAASKDNKAVAVLPYKRDEFGDPMEFLSRLELNPAHMEDETSQQISIITGVCETGDALYHARMELLEEGGYNIPEERFEFLGVVNPQKASCTKLHLYAVEIKEDDIQGTYEGDGSENEAKEDCAWLCSTLMITAKDPYIQSIMLRLMAKEGLDVNTWEEVENESVEAAKEWEANIMDKGTSGTTN